MKSRGVVGKRIKRIDQRVLNPRQGGGNQRVQNLYEIELEDGTRLRPVVGETDHGFYTVDFVVIPPPKPRRICK